MSKPSKKQKSAIWTKSPSREKTPKIRGVEQWRSIWGRDVWSVMAFVTIALFLAIAAMLIVLTPSDVTPEMSFFGK